MHPELDISRVLEELKEHHFWMFHRYPEVVKASESVVKIVAYKDNKAIGQGSGVAVEGNRLLTAAHVVEKADGLLIYINTRGRFFSTSFDGGDIEVDDELDVAAFSLPEELRSIVPLRDLETDVIYNELIFLVGYPVVDRRIEWPLHGQPQMIQPAQIRIIDTNEFHTISDGRVLQVMKGMSGGAAVNQDGNVVGVEKSSIFHGDIRRNIGSATRIGPVQSRVL